MLEAYSPLGNPASPFKGKDTPIILENPTIKEIAQKHGATVGQVHISGSYIYASAQVRLVVPSH